MWFFKIDFVIADQDCAIVLSRKCRHAIMKARYEQTVIHRLTRAGENAVIQTPR